MVIILRGVSMWHDLGLKVLCVADPQGSNPWEEF
jgi:hypothetical protein